MTVLIKANKLTKKFGSKTVLRNLDFEIRSGQVIGLLGPNAAGKTTLIKTIMGILPSSSGSLEIMGQPQSFRSKANLAYMPDMNPLFPWMRIRDAIQYYRDMFTDFDIQRSAEFSQILRLDINDRVSECSRGMQQRVMIMLTLSRRASLYLLDEPIGGIDPLGVNKILKTVFSGMHEESSILIATHLVKEIEPLVDEVFFLHEGQLIYQANAETIRTDMNQSIEERYLEVYENA